MSSDIPSLNPSEVLRSWVLAINEQTQLGLEVNDDNLCAIENKDGSVIFVNAIDSSGYVVLASPIAKLPDDPSAQVAMLKAIALANFRDLVAGPAKWSLHPNGEDLYFELPILNPERYTADEFAEKLFAFMSQHMILREKIADGSFSEWAESNFRSEAAEGGSGEFSTQNFIRI